MSNFFPREAGSTAGPVTDGGDVSALDLRDWVHFDIAWLSELSERWSQGHSHTVDSWILWWNEIFVTWGNDKQSIVCDEWDEKQENWGILCFHPLNSCSSGSIGAMNSV